MVMFAYCRDSGGGCGEMPRWHTDVLVKDFWVFGISTETCKTSIQGGNTVMDIYIFIYF